MYLDVAVVRELEGNNMLIIVFAHYWSVVCILLKQYIYIERFLYFIANLCSVPSDIIIWFRWRTFCLPLYHIQYMIAEQFLLIKQTGKVPNIFLYYWDSGIKYQTTITRLHQIFCGRLHIDYIHCAQHDGPALTTSNNFLINRCM